MYRTAISKYGRFIIIQSMWHSEITDTLVQGAKEELISQGIAADRIAIIQVSGSWELVFASKKFARSHQICAVIPVGVLLKGETMHFEYIASAVSDGLMQLNLKFDVPVVYGVLNVYNLDQARYRAGMVEGGHNHGRDWAIAAIELASLRLY